MTAATGRQRGFGVSGCSEKWQNERRDEGQQQSNG
jgi:hypothetical protein